MGPYAIADTCTSDTLFCNQLFCTQDSILIRPSKKQTFDRAHTTSYLTLIETMHLSCTVFEIYSRLFVESRRF